MQKRKSTTYETTNLAIEERNYELASQAVQLDGTKMAVREDINL
jgi:hypothetical protein